MKKQKTLKERKKRYYVDNERFLSEMLIFIEKCKEAERLGEEPPRASNYIGECIMLIARKLSTMGNFVNYPFKEDMVMDAVENCIRYIGNFDPEKSKNPFSYFTQITYYAFLRKIYGEKKHLYTKGKIMSSHIANHGSIMENDPTAIPYSSLENEKLNVMIEEFEGNLDKKKEKRKQMLIDKDLENALAEAEKDLAAELIEE